MVMIYFALYSDSLPCKCNNSPFADGNNKHIVTGDLRIIKNNISGKIFIKAPRYSRLGLVISEN